MSTITSITRGILEESLRFAEGELKRLDRNIENAEKDLEKVKDKREDIIDEINAIKMDLNK